MRKLIFLILFILMTFPLFSQTKNDSIKIAKPKWKYEIGMALGTSVVSYPIAYPLVPTYNLEFGVAYQRWKFKLEPKVAYAKDKFNYGLTAKIGFVIWKSK